METINLDSVRTGSVDIRSVTRTLLGISLNNFMCHHKAPYVVFAPKATFWPLSLE